MQSKARWIVVLGAALVLGGCFEDPDDNRGGNGGVGGTGNQAPTISGTPPPIPFAHEMASGTISGAMYLHAIAFPHRPKPDCTSSNINKRSCSRHNAATARRNSGVAG